MASKVRRETAMDKLSRKARLYISLGVIGAIIAVSMSVIFYGVYQVYYDPASLFRNDFGVSGRVEEHFEERIINVVVLGLHNRQEDNTFGDIYYVDTIMVASINFDRDSLSLLAVPRDSYVEIAHSGEKDRLRQSYEYGYEQAGSKPHQAGMQYALDTIDQFLEEIELDYYIAMDIEGLKQLIDSMGGVYYTVEEEMVGFTPQESLEAGSQMLDGQGYLTYMTYREEDARDDINRIERQKSLLLATFEYFQEMGHFRYVVPTYNTYREHVRTNLNFNQVAALTLFASERLEADAIKSYSLQGEYFAGSKEGIYYLDIDPENKAEMIYRLTGGQEIEQ
ncbi:MAG: LCP family protein [Bacillota bacterium]